MAFLNETGLGYFLYRLKDLVGKRNGIAPLSSLGKVPQSHLPQMEGATASDLGSSGIVPTPQPGDQAKYLRGDGQWAEAFIASQSDQDKYLRGDGQWAGIPIVYTSTSEAPTGSFPDGTIWLSAKE